MPDPVRVDAAARRAWQGERELTLTGMAFDLLACLVANAGRVVSSGRLQREVWRSSGGVSRTVSQTVLQVRRALGESADEPAYITTIRGRGWRFDAAMVGGVPVPVDERVPVLIIPLPADLAMVGAVLEAAAPTWEARYGARPTTEHLVQRDTPWGTAAVLLPPTEGEGHAD